MLLNACHLIFLFVVGKCGRWSLGLAQYKTLPVGISYLKAGCYLTLDM